MKTAIKNIECFVFDMDGTIYLGNEVIDGSIELINYLKNNGYKYFFFTNNSSKSPEVYVEKLRRLGYGDITRDYILTSADVTISFLKDKFGENPRVYLAGTPALEEQFTGSGISLVKDDYLSADCVVLGFDTTFNFEKANIICEMVAANKPFYATNIDRVCPLEGGKFLPDCGSMSQMIYHATGIMPQFLGKPFKETVDYILKRAGTKPENTAVIGDRLYTDIKTANNGNLISIGVLSGEMTLDDINSQTEITVDYLYDSVKDLYDELRK